MMTDTQFTIIIAAIPTTIAAISGMIVSIRNGRKADDIIQKAVEIHTLTNSNLSKVTASLEVANAKIEGLQKMVEAMARDKAIADNIAAKTAERTL